MLRIKPHNGNSVKKFKQTNERPHIEIRNLSYVYPGQVPFQALYHINMTVNRGEFVGLVGQNGSGKTTLLKNVLGILKPTEGEIFIDGVNSKEASVAEWSYKIGLVLQNPDIQLFRMSAAEEVVFGLEKLGLPDDVIQKRVGDALRATGLLEFKDVYPFKLSFGDRRKLAVAAVVAMEPQVLIFDEPTTGQDYRGRYELVEIARQLNEQGTTVIMVTHDMDLVAKYTQRVFVLGEGRLLLEGPTAEVFNQREILASTYLAPPQISLLAQNLRRFGVPPTVLSVDEMCQVFE
jgi:energy-coupling factor transport system ATP-binding protein